MVRPFTVSTDTNQHQHLNRIEALIQKDDFKSAAADTEKIIKKFEHRFRAGDGVLTNYIHQAKINQKLINRILSNESQKETLATQFKKSKVQNKTKTMTIKSHGSKTKLLEKKMALLEQENQLLKKQIEQIKQIDLNTKTVQ